MKNLILLIVLASTMTLSSGFKPKTESFSKYALTCITNSTNFTIGYSIKWGNRNWKEFKIEPGRQKYHSWTYASSSDPHSPELKIKYDCSPSPGYQEKEYDLERYRASEIDCNMAKKYVFKMPTSKEDRAQSIEIYSQN